MKTKMVNVSDVVEVNPRLPSQTAKQLELEVDFIPMASLSDTGTVIPNGSRLLREVIKGYTYFANGDVIVAKITPCMENGKAAYVDKLPHGIGFGSTEFHVLRPNADLDGRFLFYMIWNASFRREAAGKMTGSAGQKRVPRSFFDRYKIPFPSQVEQKRIASILAKADAIRRKQSELLHTTDSLIVGAFHDMFGNPVVNPRKWRTERLGDVATLDRGRSRHRPRDATFLYGGPYPFIQTGDIANSDGYITGFTQTYSEEGLAQSKLWPVGTLGITIAANIAKTAILTFNACFPDSIVGLIPGKSLTTEYVRYWFVAMEKAIDASATQVAQKNINLQILNDLKIQLPPLELQKQFSSLVKDVRATCQRCRTASVESDNLFNALAQSAFQGNL